MTIKEIILLAKLTSEDRIVDQEDKILLITDIHCEERDTLLQKRPIKVYKNI